MREGRVLKVENLIPTSDNERRIEVQDLKLIVAGLDLLLAAPISGGSFEDKVKDSLFK